VSNILLFFCPIFFNPLVQYSAFLLASILQYSAFIIFIILSNLYKTSGAS
jgi:hypothetical protein